MPSSSPYPSNWKEISLELKKKANWTCQKCGRKCIEPGQKVPEDWTVSKRMAYTLPTHHWDRDPSNSSEDNLICVCTGCHLDLHRGYRGKLSNVSEGQLSLFPL